MGSECIYNRKLEDFWLKDLWSTYCVCSDICMRLYKTCNCHTAACPSPASVHQLFRICMVHIFINHMENSIGRPSIFYLVEWASLYEAPQIELVLIQNDMCRLVFSHRCQLFCSWHLYRTTDFSILFSTFKNKIYTCHMNSTCK